MLYFITEGSNVRIKDGDNDFKVLSNTSKCIDWTVYSSTIDLSIDEVTFDGMNPTNIYFDGVASANAAAVVTSLKAMFSNLGGGSSVKTYRAILSQTGTDNPVATVLENTLGGTPSWARVSDGYYEATLTGAFTENKTLVFIGNNSWIDASFAAGWASVNGIFVVSGALVAGAFVETDAYLSDTPIEILVYP